MNAPPPARAWPALVAWAALLLPMVLLFPPIPIDETRYLSVAWEMYNSGQWLVPTLGGAWYTDKSPLLFWLIVGGWKLFGVHTWVARGEALAIALGILLALRRLALRLGWGMRDADAALWVLAGALGFAVFSTAIMFDLLLTLTVLGGMHALLDLDSGRWRRGIVIYGCAIGCGVLAKGPVLLLHLAPVALLAPLWSARARADRLRWYAAVLLGTLLGALIVAAWLLPAASYAGAAYWQPLIGKVVGRIHDSFAHSRPWWWYLPLVPLLLLPWLLALRAPRVAWAGLWRGRGGRFLWCWWVAPFVGFCLISGKQVHYLLPLLPAWALAGAWLLGQPGARLRPLLFGLLALALAAAIAAMPWHAARTFGFAPRPLAAAFALPAAVVAVGAWRWWGRSVRGLALSATALMATVVLAATFAYWPAIDVAPAASFARQELRAGAAIAQVGADNGIFGYVARLRRPLPAVPYARITAWAADHPDGILLITDGHLEPKTGTPYRTWPYFLAGDRRIAAWRAAEILHPGGR